MSDHRENSSLFSLEQLAQPGPARASNLDDESGLIDLNAIVAQQARGESSRQYTANVPPPLREEATLNAVTALAAPRSTSRPGFWIGFGVAMLSLSLGLGYLLSRLPSAGSVAATPAPTVIVYSAPPPSSEVDRVIDRVNGGEASPEPRHAGGLGANQAVAGSEPLAKRPKTTPKKSPKARTNPEALPTRASKATARSSDPCAQCGGDLSCAMRCAVKK